MSKFIAVLAMVSLLCVGSMANATITLTIDNVLFSPSFSGATSGIFSFDVLVGFDPYGGSQGLSGMGMGVLLGGNTAGFSSTSPSTPVDFTTYAWKLDSGVTANWNEMMPNIPGGNTLAEAFSCVLDWPSLPEVRTVIDGDVLAHFAFNYTSAAQLGNIVTINLVQDGGNFAQWPYLLDGTGSYGVIYPTVTNDNLSVPMIPEPATLSLLALGLVGLVTRRKK